MIQFLVTWLLSLLNKIVPDGMKVYVMAILGVLFGLLLMSMGDFVFGGSLFWMGLTAFVGRHTAEKVMEAMKESAGRLDELKGLAAPNLPKVPENEPTAEARIF